MHDRGIDLVGWLCLIWIVGLIHSVMKLEVFNSVPSCSMRVRRRILLGTLDYFGLKTMDEADAAYTAFNGDVIIIISLKKQVSTIITEGK